LKESQGGTEWAAISTLKRKPDRFKVTEVETFGQVKKKLQFSEEKVARRDLEIIKLKSMLQDVKCEKDVFAAEIKSLIKKVQEMTNEKLQKEEEVALNPPPVDPIHLMLVKSDPLSWVGIASVEDFYLEVEPFLTSYYSHRYGIFVKDRFVTLCNTLIQLRNGLISRVLLPLLTINHGRDSHRRTFGHVIDDLYKWALTQIFLLPASEWLLNSTELLDALFPGHLFYFVDGTVLQIFEPSDVTKAKRAYNQKHGFCALSFFIICAPNGRIVYISCMDWGSTHDATAWNTSLEFPPVDEETGEERPDNKSFISSLEEFYGAGHSEDYFGEDVHPHPGKDI